jgi:hypothetical protein
MEVFMQLSQEVISEIQVSNCPGCKAFEELRPKGEKNLLTREDNIYFAKVLRENTKALCESCTYVQRSGEHNAPEGFFSEESMMVGQGEIEALREKVTNSKARVRKIQEEWYGKDFISECHL